ncbi:MAG: methyltransferase domain-containing protein, partial [Planctomycetales bacterium]|nr:methyltransferase domain-containing protein [Planctomycetales bacterium]
MKSDQGQHRACDRCRSCGGADLLGVLNLGEAPLADGLIRPKDTAQGSARYPLEAAVCRTCWLMQLTTTVAPDELYCRDYPYYSSFSDEWLEHSRRNALRLIDEERLTERDLVIEVASNDGYLLRNFVAAGVPALGIDPAAGPAEAAQAVGVPTIVDFFSLSLAQRLREQGRRPRVIVANNVLAHATDTNDFVAGLKELLHAEGVASLEFPYLVDLIDRCEFDTIYHEHLCYFSLTSALALFARHGLTIHRVERLATHGGSLRLHVSHDRPAQPSVAALLMEEERRGVASPDFYLGFRDATQMACGSLRDLLGELRRRGRSIAA